MTPKQRKAEFDRIAEWVCRELSCYSEDASRTTGICSLTQIIRAAKEAMEHLAHLDDPHTRVEDVIADIREKADAIVTLSAELGGIVDAAGRLSQALAGVMVLPGKDVAAPVPELDEPF